MRCPQCDSPDFSVCHPCAACQFTADEERLIQHANLGYLLGEMASWVNVPPSTKEELGRRYGRQQRQVEVSLGLRPPPLTAVDAEPYWVERDHLRAAVTAVARWRRIKWLEEKAADAYLQTAANRLAELDDRLLDAPQPLPVMTKKARARRLLVQKQFVLDVITDFFKQQQIDQTHYYKIARTMQREIAALEHEAGLVKPPAQPAPKLAAPAKLEEPVKPASAAKPRTARRFTRPSLTWDQVWETLLSERTLQAILFLGVVLLFAAGISWVVWNWGLFPPAVQVAFLGGFTAVFYGLGWHVHHRMGLHGSGIALLAVGSLLVPLDFYAFYLSGGFPAESWPLIWWVTSAICLAAYLATAVFTQTRFFGYLVGIAAGSLAVASINLAGWNRAWWQVGVGFTAVTLVVIRKRLANGRGRWQVLARPLGQIALIMVMPTLILGLGWGFLPVGVGEIGMGHGPLFHTALALNWWLGSVVFVSMVRPVRLRSLAWVAALSFPVAVWLSLRLLVLRWGVTPGWIGLGWAALVPCYLLLGRRWQRQVEMAIYGRIFLRVAGGLIVLAAVWSMQSTITALPVHVLLAAVMVMTAVLWAQPRALWGMSLFLLTAAAAWQGGRGATPAELILPWTLLAVLHIVAGLWLGRSGRAVKLAEYTAVLFGGGYALAALSLLPPLIIYDQSLLTYALANWIGVNVWLALLAQEQADGVWLFLARERLRRWEAGLFHWGAAMAVIPWVWLLVTGDGGPGAVQAWAYTAVAWGLLAASVRARRWQWRYGRPWQTAAYVCTVVALGLGLVFTDGLTRAGVVLLQAAFYFVAARVLHQRRALLVGGWLLPVGWLLLLDGLGAPRNWLNPGAALVAVFYLALTTFWPKAGAGRWRPLADIGLVMATGLSVLNLLLVPTLPEADLIWVALSQGLLGVGWCLFAWQRREEFWVHLGVWSGIVAAGLFVKVYSHGTGRSAALAALLALGLILAERGLYQLARRGEWWRPIRHLCRRPLRSSGWLVSAGTIGLALGRNLILLGGGVTQQNWAIVALLLVVGLYAAAARLYRQERFAWLAAGLIVVPWTLLMVRGWFVWEAPPLRWYGVNWLLLALGLTAVSMILRWRMGRGWWERPWLVVARLLVPVALVWGVFFVRPSVLAVGLGLLFYATAVWRDAHIRPKGAPAPGRFIFPLAFLLPVWGVYLFLWGWPGATATAVGVLLLAFSLPLLAVGRWWRARQPSYRLPFYIMAYATAVAGTLLVSTDQPLLIAALLFDTGLAVLSVWLFRQPLWWLPGTVTLPLAGALILAQWGMATPTAVGGLFISLGGGYVALAWLLDRRSLPQHSPPLLAMMFVWVCLGLLPVLDSRSGGMMGFALAAGIWVATAVWRRWPLVFNLAVGLALIALANGLWWLGLAALAAGLALWPFILIGLSLALLLDRRWGIEPEEKGSDLASFPWSRPDRWVVACWRRLWRWWAYGLYGAILLLVNVSVLLTIENRGGWLLALVAGTAVMTFFLFRFRQRPWLLLAWGWVELAALGLVRWLGLATSADQVALLFLPVTLQTAVMGLLVAAWFGERPLIDRGRWAWAGWSRPFYLWLGVNLVVGQFLALWGPMGTAVTLVLAGLVAVLATVWHSPRLAGLALVWGGLALWHGLTWQNVPAPMWPVALALLALAYGLPGSWLQLRQHKLAAQSAWQRVWTRRLVWGGWVASGGALIMATTNVGVVKMLLTALGLRPWMTAQEMLALRGGLLTVALVALFYLTAALVWQRRWLGYTAVLMMLTAWCGWLFFLTDQQEMQLYAMPAGAYLLGVGWAEWSWGSRRLARWIDRAALLLLFGSLFWQSFGPYGGVYALLMIGEGLVVVWFGSMRRVRRLLYAGIAGVVTAVGGQLVEPLLSANTLVLLLLGGLLVGLGIALERRLEKVRAFSKEVRALMERWE